MIKRSRALLISTTNIMVISGEYRCISVFLDKRYHCTHPHLQYSIKTIKINEKSLKKLCSIDLVKIKAINVQICSCILIFL